jgi:hypothetical protein
MENGLIVGNADGITTIGILTMDMVAKSTKSVIKDTNCILKVARILKSYKGDLNEFMGIEY